MGRVSQSPPFYIYSPSHLNGGRGPNHLYGPMVERLLIVSNQPSTEFLDSFPLSSGIKAKLDDRWPNKFEVSMPPLDANALCVFSGWKVHRLAKLLREPFLTAR